MIMNQSSRQPSHDPLNLQHVKLDLPRQQRIVNGQSWAPAPSPSQEWATSPVQGSQPRHLTLRLPVRKLAIGFAVLVGFLVTLGLGATLGQQQPDSQTQATLHYAQSHAPSGQTCGAVWLDGADHWTVQCGSISR